MENHNRDLRQLQLLGHKFHSFMLNPSIPGDLICFEINQRPEQIQQYTMSLKEDQEPYARNETVHLNKLRSQYVQDTIESDGPPSPKKDKKRREVEFSPPGTGPHSPLKDKPVTSIDQDDPFEDGKQQNPPRMKENKTEERKKKKEEQPQDHCEPHMLYFPMKDQQVENQDLDPKAGKEKTVSVAVSLWKLKSKTPFQEHEVQFVGGTQIIGEPFLDNSMHYICFVYLKQYSADKDKRGTFWFVRLLAKTLSVKDEIQIEVRDLDYDKVKESDANIREELAKTPISPSFMYPQMIGDVLTYYNKDLGIQFFSHLKSGLKENFWILGENQYLMEGEEEKLFKNNKLMTDEEFDQMMLDENVDDYDIATKLTKLKGRVFFRDNELKKCYSIYEDRDYRMNNTFEIIEWRLEGEKKGNEGEVIAEISKTLIKQLKKYEVTRNGEYIILMDENTETCIVKFDDPSHIQSLKFGSSFRFRRNQNLFSMIMGSYEDMEGKPGIFMLRDNNKDKELRLQSVAIDEYKVNKKFDIFYEERNIFEVSAGEFTNLRVGHHLNTVNSSFEDMKSDHFQSNFSILREFSEFQLSYPYLLYCKGNKEIMIRNCHQPDILFRLVIEDSFFSFANASFDPDLVRIEKKLAERKDKNDIETSHSLVESQERRRQMFVHVTPDNLKEKVGKIYDKINKRTDTAEKIYFISIKGKVSYINVLKLSPYTKGVENQMILHYKQKRGSAQVLKMNQSHLIESFISESTFQKKGRELRSYFQITQYNKMLHAINYSKNKSKTIECSDMRAVQTRDDCYDEVFVIKHENLGSKILSVFADSKDVASVESVYDEPSQQIIMLTRRGNQLFMMDDFFSLNQFEITRTGDQKFSRLEHTKVLETSDRGKDFLAQKRLDGAFDNHLRALITQNNTLHFKRWSVKFVNDQDLLQLQNLNQEDTLVPPKFEVALEENQNYDEEDYQDGPLLVGKDCMTYFYKRYNESQEQDQSDKNMSKERRIDHFCYITQGMDSKINLLLDQEIPFATFLPTPLGIGKERMLVQVGNGYYILKPNGEIIQQVECKDQRYNLGRNCVIKGVSDNLEHFIFKMKDCEVLMKLVLHKIDDEPHYYEFEVENESNLNYPSLHDLREVIIQNLSSSSRQAFDGIKDKGDIMEMSGSFRKTEKGGKKGSKVKKEEIRINQLVPAVSKYSQEDEEMKSGGLREVKRLEDSDEEERKIEEAAFKADMSASDGSQVDQALLGNYKQSPLKIQPGNSEKQTANIIGSTPKQGFEGNDLFRDGPPGSSTDAIAKKNSAEEKKRDVESNDDFYEGGSQEELFEEIEGMSVPDLSQTTSSIRKKFDFLLIENLIRDKDPALRDPKKVKIIHDSVFVTNEGKVANLLKVKIKKNENRLGTMRDDNKSYEFMLFLKYGDYLYPKAILKDKFAEDVDLKMVITDNYIIIAPSGQTASSKEAAIWYSRFKYQANKKTSQYEIFNLEFQKLELTLNQKEWEVQDIVQVKARNRIQLVLKNAQKQVNAFLTWNLKKNMEDRNIEFNDVSHVALGINSTFNFGFGSKYVYDFEFSLPLNFYQVRESVIPSRLERTVNETRNLLLLKLESGGLVICSAISAREQRFYDKFKALYEDQQKSKGFPLTMTKCMQNNGDNFFHSLVQDYNQLCRFHSSYLKVIHACEDAEERDKMYDLYTLILVPNLQNRSPFDIAMLQSSQFVDQLLKMLTEVPNYQLSKFIFKDASVFRQLIEMELPSFATFLERCFFQTLSLSQVQKRNWKHGSKLEWVGSHHTSLITKEVLNEMLGEEELKEKQEEELDISFIGKFDENSYVHDYPARLTKMGLKKQNMEVKKEEVDNKSDIKRVEVTMVELDWIFKGESGKLFVDALANTRSEVLFEVQSLKFAIKYLWGFYFYRLLLLVFVPYVLFFIAFLVYATYLYEGPEEKYLDARIALAVCCIIFGLFSLFQEGKQMLNQGANYFIYSNFFWNVTDVSSTLMVIVFCICDMAKVDYSAGRVIASVAVLLLWAKLFYFLRIFAPTAAFIRMITEIIKEMSTFTLIFFLSIIAIGNALFLVDGGYFAKDNRVAGDDIIMTIVNTYTTGLGSFDTENYSGNKFTVLYWIFFFITTVLIQIVLLNLLIALMGDTFDKVQEIKEQAQLKEVCRIMSENWYFLKQSKMFRKVKYVTIGRIEKAEGSTVENWEGKLAHLKNYFIEQMTELEMAMKGIQGQEREEMGAVQRQIGQQVNFMQHQLHKNSQVQEKSNYLLVKQIEKMHNDLIK